MTTPVVALVLCLIHVSLVAAAALVVRACVARRLAASRAAIGAVGMACVLVVTALAFIPLPSLWPGPGENLDKSAIQNAGTTEPIGETAAARASTSGTSTPQSDLAHDPAARFAISLAWLRRVGAGLDGVTAAAKAAPRGWIDLLIAVLLCGAGVGIARLVLALRAVRGLYRASTAITGANVVLLAAALQRDCGCRRPIELRETDQLASAATFGFFRPVILLPSDWTEWSTEELAAALAHEVAHVRRGDYLRRLIARLGEAVYFYHPLVRAAARRLIVDQEFAADRLAGSLGGQQAYLRGLARLAIRGHDSFETGGGWSSVSIMPKSSDFLARRLEMLQSKQGSAGKLVERFVSWGAAGSVLAIALVVTLLRSPVASAQKPADEAAPPVEAAQPAGPAQPAEPTRPVEEVARRIVPSASPDKSERDGQTDGSLFAREPFDVSIIPRATRGVFLFRLGTIMQLPELQPHLDALNRFVSAYIRDWAKNPEIVVDVRQIEWIAGSLIATVELTAEKDGKDKFMLGSGNAVIRMAQAGDWQETILRHVTGSSLKTHNGRTYVELPPLPPAGDAVMQLLFPDDKTIIAWGFGEKAIFADLDETDADKKARQPYAWADAWRAVDGGLITVVYDHDKLQLAAQPAEKKEWPAFATPLLENVKYYAAGWDWLEKSQRTAVRVQGTCADQATVAALELAAATLFKQSPEMLSNPDEQFGKHQDRVLGLISSARLLASPPDGDQHFVRASAEGPLSEQDLIDILVSQVAN